MKEKKRGYYEEIDVIRGLLMIMVFLTHTSVLQYLDMGFLPLKGNFFAWATMVPSVFFFISGLVLTMRYKDTLNIKSFYWKRYRYLGPAYFLWAFLIFIIRDGGFNFQSYVNIYTGVLVWDLWFIFVIFQFYLIFPLLLKICKKVNKKVLFITIFIFTCMVYNLNFNIDWYRPIYIFQSESLEINTFRFFWFIPHLIYFLMGILIGFNYEKFKEKLEKYKIFIIANWIGSTSTLPLIVSFEEDITPLGFYNIWLLIYSISTILFFFWIFNQKRPKFLIINGTIAIGLFLLNRVVFLLVDIIVPIPWTTRFNLFFISVFCFELVYMVSLVLVAMIRRIPYYQFILTEIGEFNLSDIIGHTKIWETYSLDVRRKMKNTKSIKGIITLDTHFK